MEPPSDCLDVGGGFGTEPSLGITMGELLLFFFLLSFFLVGLNGPLVSNYNGLETLIIIRFLVE